MTVWIIIIISSVLIGIATGVKLRGITAIATGAFIPWIALLAMLLFSEYCLSYRGGGASMWPIAQLFGGTIAALIGGISTAITQFVRRGT